MFEAIILAFVLMWAAAVLSMSTAGSALQIVLIVVGTLLVLWHVRNRKWA